MRMSLLLKLGVMLKHNRREQSGQQRRKLMPKLKEIRQPRALEQGVVSKLDSCVALTMVGGEAGVWFHIACGSSRIADCDMAAIRSTGRRRASSRCDQGRLVTRVDACVWSLHRTTGSTPLVYRFKIKPLSTRMREPPFVYHHTGITMKHYFGSEHTKRGTP